MNKIHNIIFLNLIIVYIYFYRYDLAALLSNVLKLHGGIAVPWKNNNGAEVIKEEDENYEEDIRRNAHLRQRRFEKVLSIQICDWK